MPTASSRGISRSPDSYLDRNRYDADLERVDGFRDSLKNNRPEDNIDPAVEEFAFSLFLR